jgi:hypothetical protein
MSATDEILKQATRDGLEIRLGAPGRIKLRGATEVVERWKPIFAQHKAELLTALSPPPDDRSELEDDTESQVATAEVLHLAAHPDRTAFALKNHADAVLHFRKLAADAERLAAMYRIKCDGHIDAARQRVNPEAFDAWLQSICRK